MAELVKLQPLEAKEVPIPRIRKAIAKNLKNAMDSVAYCSLVQKVNATALYNHRKAVLAKVQEQHGVKLTFLSWIIRAVVIALSEYPIFAAKVNEETGQIIYPGELNIGIAVDTPRGLVVPVIKGADKLSIVEIQQEIVRLATLARDGKLSMADMQGGHYTITNVGSVGVMWGTPIMNYPEIAITAVGAMVDEPLYKDGQWEPVKMMYLSIAADHRWVDGADMGRFNGRVKELLEMPEVLGEL
ncbi:2-oxo acid dehydrogenase subunit E2 [Mycoplasmopsis columbina]|uniref:Dihydrolipoamide acetyltransferase component ofpyruvate deshydrogenase complex n=1 Tax=Mycoplasmopsis columbina SF7 TaxID=1037410 RepID=F9UJV8_9BACT|nr:2-oxo acid dehydrogenase subunit E2 [Mycoplasmopsis columbina]EGV00304.1 dihydrolipoamide acetyltransferase component ofpyruvate deshydrogenase complex [Mycoplasmopsis columbina SF7]VEU76832.1 pyruvate dehydrogenase E2 component (dihydrolipoamide acetyltransferase) [Mycoplasmopsis columbina]